MISTLNAVVVPGADEIGLAHLVRPAFLVVTSADPDSAVTLAGELSETIGPTVVRVPPPPTQGFATFEAIDGVRAALLPTVQREAPNLLDDPWLASGLNAGPRHASKAGLTYLAESVAFAVTRRISRESHQSALIIDRMANALLRARRACATFADGLTLLITDLHAWDRPSLRCLYRLALLAAPSDRFRVVGIAADPPFALDLPDDDPWARIAPARGAFFTRLAATGVVRTVAAPAASAAPAPVVEEAAPAHDYADLLLSVGDALVFQNYERVYYLVRQALRDADDQHQEAQVRRLIAIADAQLEDFAAAEAQLRRAVDLSQDPAFTAHLHYLRGLIATKRHYDLDVADELYAAGLAALGEPPADDTEPVGGRVERAWLCNGQALVLTLRAKQTDDATAREEILARAFDLELRAFRLVRGAAGAAPAYLRHNLMANLTFLLEVSRRFDEAVRFWTQAFDSYLAADSAAFQVAFDARKGLLLFKAGDEAGGIAQLEQARETSHTTGDRFAEEELCLKLGYAYGASGDPSRAYNSYRDALRIGHSLREMDICLDALAGMLWSLADLGIADSFHELRGRVVADLTGTPVSDRLKTIPDEVASAGELTAALTEAGVRRPMPSPKQRAYIASVDLEGTPARDLNRYLVWGGGPLPRREQPAAVDGGPQR